MLSCLAWGLFLSGVFNFLQRFFYAQGDFRTPFLVSLVWAATDVVVSVTLMLTPLGVVGLAAGSVAGFAVGALTLLLLAWKTLPWSRLATLGWFLVRIALALLPVTGLWLLLVDRTGPWWSDGLTWTSSGLLVGEGLGALALVLGSLLAVGIKPWKLLRPAPESKESVP